MITKHTFGAVDVYSLSLDACPAAQSENVRSRERKAVDDMLTHVYGPGTKSAHHTDGAPYIIGHPEIHLSVSHCRRMAVIALAPFPIGIDVEEARPSLLRIAPRFLTSQEQENYATLPQLLEAWTLKEAAFKALRPGTPATRMPLPPAPLPYSIIHTGPHPDDGEVFMALVVKK